jgi:cysteine synthase A
MGDLHLEIIQSKLLNEYKAEITVDRPKVAFRETIRKNSDAEYKYKKQTGGHGQYGHVKIRFSPSGTNDPYVFDEEVVGGAVPRNFFPAVEKGIAAFSDVIEHMKKGIENPYATRQLDNPDNINAHYKHTGPEIWEDTDGKVDIFVGGVGTGGSTHGVSKFLKEKNPNVKVVITQPDPNDVVNPIIKGVEDGGFHGIHQVHNDDGITPLAPANFSDELTDEYSFISYAETLRAIHLLAQYEGIFVGASAGASLAVAIKLAQKEENAGKLIVPLLPDNGERYLSEDLQLVRPEVEENVGF